MTRRRGYCLIANERNEHVDLSEAEVKRAQDILDRIQYRWTRAKGLRLTVYTNGLIELRFDSLPDTDAPNRKHLKGGFFFHATVKLRPGFTEEDVLCAAYLTMAGAEAHERTERFLYRGVAVFNAHNGCTVPPEDLPFHGEYWGGEPRHPLKLPKSGG